jgi:diaminopimelate epimerase
VSKPKEVLFSKIQATGNDFIIIDYASVEKDFFSGDRIQNLCHRNFGIGADGLIALEKTEGYPFRFHYYNSDGSRGEMCANGCRAAICYAQENNWIVENVLFQFLADDGVHQAEILKDGYAANIIVNGSYKKINPGDFKLPIWIKTGYKINTGVPHLVLFCESGLQNREIKDIGKYLRFHEQFSPDGTNVNFVEIVSHNKIFVRTYERGVESETLSCGTGITASAIIFKDLNDLTDKVEVVTSGGDLQVSFKEGNIFIKGPSKISFKGYFML